MGKNVFTSKFEPRDEDKLRKMLEADGFSLAPVEHAYWQAQKLRTFITFYRSGKVVIRGKDVEDAAQQYLASLKAEQKIHGLEAIDDLSEWIGTDESGKGDFFGPLVVAALLVTKKSEHRLWALGVQDSKKLSDQKIVQLAGVIRKNFLHSVVSVAPKKYNQLYAQFGNLNKLLASAHAQAIENLLEKTSCSVVLSDQFGDESLIRNALGENTDITLIQKNHAEENLAVAGASILAREKFLSSLSKLSDNYKIFFPPGSGKNVIETANRFVHMFGQHELQHIAKLHFKTANEIIGNKKSG